MAKPIRRSSGWGACCGFAYLWTLLLVAQLGLGLVIGMEVYATSVQRDKEYELLAIGRQFRTALQRYYEMQRGGPDDGKGEYPATLDDLLKDNRSPGIRRHLRRVFVDPMTGKPEWGLVKISGRIVGVHSLSEKRPIKQDRFEPEEAGFRGKQKYSDWVFTYPPHLLAVNDGAAPGVPMPAASAASQSVDLGARP